MRTAHHSDERGVRAVQESLTLNCSGEQYAFTSMSPC
jgi:hypothetical protein